MGRAKVILQARINRSDLKFPFVPVKISRNAIQFPIEWTPEGTKKALTFENKVVMGYYLRYRNNGADQGEPVGKRVTKPLGTDAVAAYTQYVEFERDFERASRGLAPLIVVNEAKHSECPTLVQAIAKYERDLAAEGKKRRTVESYAGRLRNFQRFFDGRNRTLDRITEDDIRAFMTWLPKNIKQRKGSGGHFNNTMRNHLRDIGILFRRFHVAMPLSNKYWPKEMPKRKRKYSTDSIKAMLAVCGKDLHLNNAWEGEDERDLVLFLLQTGFRDEEVAHAQYSDINFKKGSINVYVKPEFNWSPKDNESREQDIDLSEAFLQRMKARRERRKAKNSDLIFPNKLGKPYLNEGLLNVIRRLVKRAGLETKASLHMFRKTFGTLTANARGLEQARIWLGHDDVQTTQDYLAADDDVSSDDSRKKQHEIFAAFGD